MTERIMGAGRLEAFSDGVIAILITIMVLELKVPASHEAGALLGLWSVFVSYLLSFLVIAIYWVNHHELFHHCRQVNTAVLWTNMAFLFCISLIPFATAYMGENHFSPFATALYGGSLLLAGASYVPMRRAVERQLDDDPASRRVSRRAATKNYISLTLYAVSMPLAYVHPAITLVLAYAVAALYFVPNAWLGERPHA